MSKVPRKTFNGGYVFKNFRFKPKPEPELIHLTAEIPERVTIPLRQGFGQEVLPLVKKGDRVKAGQIIGRNDITISSPVHSSVSGIVEDLKTIDYLTHQVKSIVIKTENREAEFTKIDGIKKDWQSLTKEELFRILYLSGVCSLDQEGLPTPYRTAIINAQDVNSLVIHSVESDVYNLTLDGLSNAKEVLKTGLEVLKKAFPSARLILCFSSDWKIGRFKDLGNGAEVHFLKPKYPQEFDEMLIKVLFNKKYPFGYSANSLGIVLLSLPTLLYIYEAVVLGKPLIEKLIGLCGPNFSSNHYLKVRIGTPIREVVKDYLLDDSTVIVNSLLTGTEIQNLDLPVDKDFNLLIAMPKKERKKLLPFLALGARKDSYSNTFLSKFLGSKKEADLEIHGEERPCIYCSFCDEVCPVNISPHLISRYVAHNMILPDHLMRYKIFDCVDCNLCSYVCPSKIPLAENIKIGKEKLMLEGVNLELKILTHFRPKRIGVR